MKFRIRCRTDGNDEEYFIVQYNDFLPFPLWFTLQSSRANNTFDTRYSSLEKALERLDDERNRYKRQKIKSNKIVYKE